MKSIKIQVNKIIPNYTIGQIVIVDTDTNGMPFNKFWRDRLFDAKTDNCIEIVKSRSPTKHTQASSKGDK